MKKIFFIAAAVFIGCSVQAQNKLNKKDVIGNWVISAVSIEGTYHDFETDSTVLSVKTKGKFKNAQDSTANMEFLKLFFEMVKGAGFSFDAKGIYKETDSEGKGKTGTYTLNEKSGIVTTKINGAKKSNNLKTEIKAGVISFKDLGEQKDLIIYCKKKK